MTAASDVYKRQVPYAINGIPFDRFGEPFAIWLKMAADIAYLSSEMDDAERMEMAVAWSSVGVSGLFNASFLTGIDNLIDAIKGKAPGAIAQDYVATQVPFGGLLAFVAGAEDPYKKAYRNADLAQVLNLQADVFGTGLLAKVAARLPGVDTVPMRYDQVMGQPVPLYPGHGTRGLNPLQMAIPVIPRGEPNGDRTWEMVFEMAGQYRESTPKAEKVATAEEKQQFNRAMATVTIDGLTFAQAIRQMYQTPEVQGYLGQKGLASNVRTGIQEQFSKMQSRYRARAEQVLRQQNRSYGLRAAQFDLAEDLGAQNDVQGAQQATRRAMELLNEARGQQ